MRYSFRCSAAPDAIGALVKDEGKRAGADQHQLVAVGKTVAAMAKDLAAYGTVTVVVEGHANEGHAPKEGMANDYLRVKVYAEPS